MIICMSAGKSKKKKDEFNYPALKRGKLDMN